jgi:multidrug transporter EmrE-like cation transporter
VNHTVSEYYYLDWLAFGFTLCVFVIGIRRGKTHKELRLIFYYIILSLVVDFSTIYLYFFSRPTYLAKKLDHLAFMVFVWGEYGLFMTFIARNLSNRRRKLFSVAIMILFYCYCIALSFFHLSSEKFSIAYSSWYSIGLIIVSLFYFHELFHKTATVQIKELPAFWVVAAILFYAGCSFPIFLFQNFLFYEISEYYMSVFSINYFLYSLVYLLFIKAYLCKKKIEYE